MSKTTPQIRVHPDFFKLIEERKKEIEERENMSISYPQVTKHLSEILKPKMFQKKDAEPRERTNLI